MVRFARADGSKGSNKRQLEEPTPWTEMVTQLDSSKKKKKKSKVESENGGSVGAPELTTKKEMKNTVTEEEAKQNPVKKNKNAKKKVTKTLEHQYTINPEGKRVKVFRDGTQRTWFDLPYEESDRMTRYDGMWVKKEITCELDRLKTSLEEEDLSKREIMRKMMKAKRKAHQQLRIELIYEQKSLVSEATAKLGKGETVSKKAKGKKKNNGTISPKKKNQKSLTADNGCKSSQEKTSSVEVNKRECNLEDEGDAGKLVSTEEEPMDADSDTGEDDAKAVVTSHAEVGVKENKETNIGKLKKAKLQKGKLSTEMVPSHVTGEDNNEDEAKKIKSGDRKTEEIQTQDFNQINHDSSSRQVFVENELMTKYDGYWVLREDVESLEAAKKTELEAICAARTYENANSQAELTKEEKLALQRAMKKKKRFHNRKLLGRLSNKEKKDNGSVIKMGKKKDDSDEAVKFDGFWVKKEAADRLHNLRDRLCKEGLSPLEVDKVMLKERRKEERALKNERKMVCLNCRQPGHLVLTCPNIVQSEAVICYTCGSTEHISSACNLNKGSERSFSFATCYICKETGHISRQCPDNPRGLYPNGGACRGCGSVEHLAKDCPDMQKEKEECNIRVGRLKGEELEALDVNEEAGSGQNQVTPRSKANRPKVVQF